MMIFHAERLIQRKTGDTEGLVEMLDVKIHNERMSLSLKRAILLPFSWNTQFRVPTL